MNKSRRMDLAALLPWLGLFLLTPPVLYLFQPMVSIFGVPLLPVYLFTTWLLLILASKYLTCHLTQEQTSPGKSITHQPSSHRDDPKPKHGM